MYQFKEMIQCVLDYGNKRPDRTGTGTTGIFGYQTRFNLVNWKLPVVTIKKTHLASMIHELIWIISGDTNIKYLVDNDVKIWNEWANDKGEIGPMYGAQWRNYNDSGIDQLRGIIESLRKNPFSRRHLVTAWNPEQLPVEGNATQHNVDYGYMALAPCHAFFQLYIKTSSWHDFMTEILVGYQVDGDVSFYGSLIEEKARYEMICDDIANGKPFDPKTSFGKVLDNVMAKYNIPKTIIFQVSLQLYQRSADVGLGVPFNIASYSLLTMMIAKSLGYIPGEFIWTGGDVHIYRDHDDLMQCLDREPFDPPTVTLPALKSIFDYKADDIVIKNYKHHEHIKLKVAV